MPEHPATIGHAQRQNMQPPHRSPRLSHCSESNDPSVTLDPASINQHSSRRSSSNTITAATNNSNQIQLQHCSDTLNANIKITMSPTTSTNVRRIRRWKAFPGRNRFFCDGRIIMARQISVFYFTVTLLVGTCVLFFIFDCPYLWAKISPLIPVVAGFLFIFVLFTLFRTSFTDPGIIPRATPEEAADVERQIVPKKSNSPTIRPPPRTKEVIINNQSIKLKYCFTCKIFRPPRASHCSLCDNCVERFDHHCPWVGNCVGKRNYRFFYMFILSLAFLCIYVFSCIITHLILLSKTMTFVDAIKESPVSVVEIIICFFSVWSILGLTGFHTYLIMSNLTTNEDIKGSFSKRDNVTVRNPYSEGSIFRNCFVVLCSPLGPSLIHSRSYVYCEENIITTGPSLDASGASSSSNQNNNNNDSSIHSNSYPLQQTSPYSTYQQQYQSHSSILQFSPNLPLSTLSTQHIPTNQTSSQDYYYGPKMKSDGNTCGQIYIGHQKQLDEMDCSYVSTPMVDPLIHARISSSPASYDHKHHHRHHIPVQQQQFYYQSKPMRPKDNEEVTTYFSIVKNSSLSDDGNDYMWVSSNKTCSHHQGTSVASNLRGHHYIHHHHSNSSKTSSTSSSSTGYQNNQQSNRASQQATPTISNRSFSSQQQNLSSSNNGLRNQKSSTNNNNNSQ